MSRLQYKFWVDLRKENEAFLEGMITELKKGRVFMRAIREGLAIVYDLMHGRLDALLYYYPWVADEFRKMNGGDDDSKEQLARIEQLLLYNSIEQGGNGMLMEQANRLPRELPPRPGLPPVVDTPPDDGDASQALLDSFL